MPAYKADEGAVSSITQPVVLDRSIIDVPWVVSSGNGEARESGATSPSAAEAVSLFKEQVLLEYSQKINGVHLATNPYEYDTYHVESWGLSTQYREAWDIVDDYFSHLSEYVATLPPGERTKFLGEFATLMSEIGTETLDNLPIIQAAANLIIRAGDVNSLSYLEDMHERFVDAHGPAVYASYSDAGRTLYGDYIENKYADLHRTIVSAVSDRYADTAYAAKAGDF